MDQGVDVSWIGPYEWKARIAPSALILTPILITLFSITINTDLSFLNNLLFITFLLVSFIFIAWVFSFLVRYLGKRYEDKLWNDEKVLPAIRVIRWHDETFSEDIKKQIHEQIKRIFAINLFNIDDEVKRPQEADKQIKQARRRLISFLNKFDRDGVWNRAYEEYGFLRNLLGSRIIFLIISIIFAVFTMIRSFEAFNYFNVLLFSFNLIIFIISLIGGWYIFPKLIIVVSEILADNMWMDFLNFSDLDSNNIKFIWNL